MRNDNEEIVLDDDDDEDEEAKEVVEDGTKITDTEGQSSVREETEKQKHLQAVQSSPVASSTPGQLLASEKAVTVDATKPSVLLRPKNINDLLETKDLAATSSETSSNGVGSGQTTVSPATAAMAKHSVNLSSVSHPDYSLLPTKMTCR